MNINYQAQTYKNNQPSFQGIYSRNQDIFKPNIIQRSLEKGLKADCFKEIGEWGTRTGKNKTKSNYDRLTKHFAVLVSTVLSSFYVLNTAKSKTIEKDRKPALITNLSLVLLMSTIGGYLLDSSINKKFDEFSTKVNLFNPKNIEFKDKAGKVIKEVPLKKVIDGLKIAKGLVIFSMMYRYIGPVLATPLADKVSKLVFKNKTESNPAVKA